MSTTIYEDYVFTTFPSPTPEWCKEHYTKILVEPKEDWAHELDESVNGFSFPGDLNPMHGKKHLDSSISKMIDKKIGNNNPFYGKTHTEETKLLMSKNGHKSSEWKEYMSSKMKGRARKKIQCPHCLKSGGPGVMHRWHMDKCKNK